MTLNDLVRCQPPTVSKLRAAPDACNEEAIQVLEELLAEARAGDVIAVTGIAEIRGGYVRSFGSATMSRLQTAGALLEAAVKRLGFED